MHVSMVLLVFVGTFGSSSLDDTCCGFVKNSSRLPEGYVKSKSIAYHKYYTNVVTWYEALRICRGDGGNLAVIDSREEAEILSGMMNATLKYASAEKFYRAWIGIHGFFGVRDWTTVLGVPLDQSGYRSWSWKWGGQPDNNLSFKCVSFDYEIGLDDHRCDDQRPFFCEIPLCDVR